MQNKEIMVASKREKKKKKKQQLERVINTDPYNTINIVDEEMHTYVPRNKRCDSYMNFEVAKSSSEVRR